jgi:hypothetical protein
MQPLAPAACRVKPPPTTRMTSHTLLRAASALPLLRCVLPNAAASVSSRGAASPWSARVPQLAGFAHACRRYSASAAYTTGQPGMYAQPPARFLLARDGGRATARGLGTRARQPYLTVHSGERQRATPSSRQEAVEVASTLALFAHVERVNPGTAHTQRTILRHPLARCGCGWAADRARIVGGGHLQDAGTSSAGDRLGLQSG